MDSISRKRGASIGVNANQSLMPDVIGEAVTYISANKEPLPDQLDDLGNIPETSREPFFKALKRIFSNKGLLVAPLALVFGITIGIYIPVVPELVKIRVCELLYNYSSEFCAQIGQNKSNEDVANEIRSTTTNYVMYSTLISSIPSSIFSLFMGSWSDRHGRKYPMASSTVGFILCAAVLLFIAIFPIHPLYLMLAAAVSSIFGGWPIFMSAMNSFVGDHTDERNRAGVIAVVFGFLGIGMASGQKIGTVLLAYYGFSIPLYVYLGLHCSLAVYILIVIRDHEDFDNKTYTEMSKSSKFCSIFELQSIKDNWILLRKKRNGHARLHILLLLGSYTAMIMCIENEATILQQLLEYQPLGWTVSEYGSFSSLAGILSCVALIISIPLFKRVLLMSDTAMGVVSSLSGIFCAYGYAVSVQTWMVYTAMGVGLIRQLCFVCMQSVLIALVERTEVGKVMSIVGSIQSISQLFSAILFLKIFAATAAWWPGFVFAIQSFMLVTPLMAFCYVDATLLLRDSSDSYA